MSNPNWHELYFDWIRRQVGITANPNPRRRHQLLLEQMLNTDFEWFVPNDDNRASDGLELRERFVIDNNYEPDIRDTNCSILEMVVALCHRLAFEDGKSVDHWFWELMDNAQLRQFTDEYYEDHDDAYQLVDDILQRINQRDYDEDGYGGFFPLARPPCDQTEMELWYQMSAYLLENEEE